jgi:hypothetical protein
MALDSALQTLGQGFRIDLDAARAANRTFIAPLLPPEKRELVVTDLVTTTKVVPAPIDLGWPCSTTSRRSRR